MCICEILPNFGHMKTLVLFLAIIFPALLPKNDKNLIKTYPALSHLFQHSTTGLPTEYGEIEETISPEVLADMVQWINGL